MSLANFSQLWKRRYITYRRPKKDDGDENMSKGNQRSIWLNEHKLLSSLLIKMLDTERQIDISIKRWDRSDIEALTHDMRVDSSKTQESVQHQTAWKYCSWFRSSNSLRINLRINRSQQHDHSTFDFHSIERMIFERFTLFHNVASAKNSQNVKDDWKA